MTSPPESVGTLEQALAHAAPARDECGELRRAGNADPANLNHPVALWLLGYFCLWG